MAVGFGVEKTIVASEPLSSTTSLPTFKEGEHYPETLRPLMCAVQAVCAQCYFSTLMDSPHPIVGRWMQRDRGDLWNKSAGV